MKHFTNAVTLTQFIIDRHAEGDRVETAGFKGFMHNYFFVEGQGDFTGAVTHNGKNIHALSVSQYAETVNRLLDIGATVLAKSARGMGAVLMCAYEEPKDAATQEKLQDQGTFASRQSEASQPEGIPAISEPEGDEVSEVPESGNESSEEIQAEPEAEAPSEDTEVEPSEPVQEFGDNENAPIETPDEAPKDISGVDWDRVAKMSKIDIDVYAENFGVNLDRRSTKAKMIAQFKEALNES